MIDIDVMDPHGAKAPMLAGFVLRADGAAGRAAVRMMSRVAQTHRLRCRLSPLAGGGEGLSVNYASRTQSLGSKGAGAHDHLLRAPSVGHLRGTRLVGPKTQKRRKRGARAIQGARGWGSRARHRRAFTHHGIGTRRFFHASGFG